jgi:hypothetical protein
MHRSAAAKKSLNGPHDAIDAILILYDEGEEDRQNNLLFARDRVCEKQ